MADYPTFKEIGGEVSLTRRYIDTENKAWSAFNPSIMLSNEGEYWMAVRSSNYVLMSNGHASLTAEQKIRNKLYIVRLNPDDWSFDTTTLKEVDTKRLRDDIIRNVEDPRLFWDGENYCITATFLERTVPVARLCKITLESLESAKPSSLHIYESPTGLVEKNWMPIVGTKDFIYKNDGIIVDEQLVPVAASETTKLFRGGTQVLPLEGGDSIAVIHQLHYKIYGGMSPSTFGALQSIRQYTHRFVKYNSQYEITHMTPRFVFVDDGIEFAAGLIEKDNKYVVSLGRSDIATFMATIDKQKVLEMMEKVDG